MATETDDQGMMDEVSDIDVSKLPLKQRQRRQKQDLFLTALVSLGRLCDAADTVPMHPQTHYDWLKNDETYRPRYEWALVRQKEFVHKLITDRLHNPEGNRGGDILLIFHAKAVDPDRYREIAIHVDDKAVESMEELKRIVSGARRRQRDSGDEPQATSVQQQADEVVRKKMGK